MQLSTLASRLRDLPWLASDADAMRRRDGRISWIPGPLAVLALVAFFEVIARSGFAIPQVEFLLILLVAYVAFVEGAGAGVISAAIAVGYYAYTISPAGAPLHSAIFPWERILVVGASIPILAVLIGLLRRELERASERERSAREELSEVVENLPAGFFTVDRDKRFGYVNDRARDVLEDPRPGRKASNLREAVAPLGENAFDRLLESMREGRAVAFESHAGGDGEAWYDVQVFPVSDGLAVYFAEITQRKRIHRQAQAMQRMQAIGRLSGGIAHDFNNLLTAIKGYNELAMAEAEDGTPLRSNLMEIQKAADRAHTLTRQLLAYSRQQLLRPETLDLAEVVSDSRSVLRTLVPDSVEVEYDLEAGRCPVRVDPGQLEQILLNLVVNAVEAMPDGGTVRVEADRVEFEERDDRHDRIVDPGEYSRLTVRDTGTGMEEETVEQIFEPFFTTKRRSEGSGLGLSTVYGIVKQSGGHVHVESEPGEGTTFRILLPCVEPEAARGGDGASREERDGKARVLVIEDDEAVRSLATQGLEARGYEVVEAADGEEAIREVERLDGRFDLVLADIVLPGRSGRETGRELRQRWPDLEIVYTSGYTNQDIIEGGIARGVLEEGIEFLHKPFTPAELGEKVEEVLAGRAGAR